MSIHFLSKQPLKVGSFCTSNYKFRSVCNRWMFLKVKRNLDRLIFHRQLHEDNKIGISHFKPFSEVIESRQEQARRSILVQVQSAKSCNELYSYCSKYGGINEMLHYKIGKESMHFIVIEFKKQSSVQNVLSDCHHIQDAHIVPVESAFLWFKASHKILSKKQLKAQVPLTIENGSNVLSDKDLTTKLQFCSDISEQITTLYNATKLNDVGTRLRFLTARQIEVALSGIFPNVRAYPFGSSVNGFGKMACDLDVVLKLTKNNSSDESRLVYHCKAAAGSERSTSQRHMEAVGDLIHLFLPGCSQVRKILQAKVPIIKYYQQLTDVECDLSMSNMSGVHMSDLLYIWGSIDERVRPLVFVVRKWAEEVGLTNNFPGRWITNFSLSLLVLAFLQKPNSSPPILPPLNLLVKSAGPNDKYITEDGVDCSFLRDIKKLKFKTQNKDSLESLLVQFFEYYSAFDFSSKAVCLNQAVPITKPEHCAMYIVNPLERGLNVSKNVSLEELERLRLEIRNAAWAMQSQERKPDNWGILSLFENRKREFPKVFSPFPFRTTNRLMDVTKIFDDDESTEIKKNVEVKLGNSANSETIETKSNIEIKGMSEVKRSNETKEDVSNTEKSESELLQAKQKTGS